MPQSILVVPQGPVDRLDPSSQAVLLPRQVRDLPLVPRGESRTLICKPRLVLGWLAFSSFGWQPAATSCNHTRFDGRVHEYAALAYAHSCTLALCSDWSVCLSVRSTIFRHDVYFSIFQLARIAPIATRNAFLMTYLEAS